MAFHVQRNTTREVISVVTKEDIGTEMVVHLVYTPTSRIDGMLIPWGSQGIPEVGLVRTERLELSHLTALEPKSSVSTNSTTSA